MKIVSLLSLPITTTSHNAAGAKRQLIAPGVIPHLGQFAHVVFKPGEVASAHKHDDMYEIFLIESGEGLIQVDGEYNQVERGMCITVEPNEVHEVSNNGKEDLIITYFAITL